MEWELDEDGDEVLITTGGSCCVVSKVRQREMWQWQIYYHINERIFRVRGVQYDKEYAKQCAECEADIIEEGIQARNGIGVIREYRWDNPETGEANGGKCMEHRLYGFLYHGDIVRNNFRVFMSLRMRTNDQR